MIFVMILALLLQSSFDVASIKPNTSSDASSRVGIRPGERFVATNDRAGFEPGLSCRATIEMLRKPESRG